MHTLEKYLYEKATRNLHSIAEELMDYAQLLTLQAFEMELHIEMEDYEWLSEVTKKRLQDMNNGKGVYLASYASLERDCYDSIREVSEIAQESKKKERVLTRALSFIF